jgi:uncharacterized protein (TIGR02145 family)
MSKLKAFVRFDGSGRIVPSSLILQSNKPKVGNWKEVNSSECCNYTTTTTTTIRPNYIVQLCGRSQTYIISYNGGEQLAIGQVVKTLLNRCYTIIGTTTDSPTLEFILNGVYSSCALCTARTTTTTTTNNQTTTTTTTICINCVEHDVTIGEQVWTGCNLDVTTYRNGDPIPEVTDPTEWSSLTTGAWCYYLNNSANGPVYGKLYNWFAVNDPRGLAPVGYHIPSDTEWNTLVSYVGGLTTGGAHLKEIGECHWYPPNTGADDSSGFTGLGGGFRLIEGSGGFQSMYSNGYWWSLTDGGGYPNVASTYWLQYDQISIVAGSAFKVNGQSVRLIKD